MRKTLSAVLMTLLMWGVVATAVHAAELALWFPPEWKAKSQEAKTISSALAVAAGVPVTPRIAISYAEIFTAFGTNDLNLVNVGSFAQALLQARGLGVPLVQSITGQEMYSGVMIYPAGQDPKAILQEHPSEIAFAAGASSGESSAKAATDGKAAVKLPSHQAVAGAVNVKKAAAGFVKNWWWEANKASFPQLAMYQVPGISNAENPDHVLTASKTVPVDVRDKITAAALAHPEAFGAQKVVPFDPNGLAFSLSLMKKGQIDPLTYDWK